jgi:hypothetical protein
MKIKEIIAEDSGMAVTSAGAVADSSNSIFAVPLKRNMPRKRPKKESEDFSKPRQLANVLEDKKA